MVNNILNNINTVLEAVGSRPYSKRKLTLDDLLKMPDYSAGVKNLVENLVKVENDGVTTFDINKRNKSILYRASADKGEEIFMIIPGKRISEGTANVYNKLISDILPSWRHMPKRNNSIIFTNGYETAVEYKGYGKRISGVIYSVIPPNDALLAISPDQDIWLGFSYLAAETGLEDLDDFNNSILMFLAFFYKFIRNKDLIDKIEASEYEAFKTLKDILSEEIFIVNKLKNIFTKPGKSLIVNMFNEIDKLLADERARNIILPIYEKYANDNPFPNTGEYIIEQKTLNPNISILSILDKLLDPEENGFALIQYALFLENTFPISEIWTDKPCVFIDINDPNLLAELYMKYNRLKKGKEV